MKKRLDFRFEVPPPPDGPLVELSASEIENLLLKNLDEAGADPTKALWQLAQLKHQVLQRRVAAVGQQRRQNVRDLLVGREAPDEPVGGTFVFPKWDTATYPKAMADAQVRR